MAVISERKPTSAILISVSEYQRRKENGECTYAGCDELAADDSSLCPPHRDSGRARAKKAQRKRRAAWKRNGLCMRCGRRRTPGHGWGCPKCIIELGRTDVTTHVNKSARVKDRTVGIAERDGYVRARYVGQPRTGPQSKTQLDEQDLSDAVARLNRAKAGLAYAASPEVTQLPRIQRLEATKAALSQAYHGVRFVIEVLDRHGEDVTQLVVRPRDDDD